MSLKKHVQSIASNRFIRKMIRYGYAVHGVLYMLIGWFALGLAVGLENRSLNQNDILNFISLLPLGSISLVLLFFGLLGYAAWGFIRASLLAKNIFERLGYLMSGFFYGSLLFPTYAILRYHIQSTQKMTWHTFSSMLIHIPFGQFILASVGVISIISGLIQIYKAFQAKKPRDVLYMDDKVRAIRLFMLLSRLGIGMRALLWVLIGIFLCISAYFADPSEAKSMDEVFNSLVTYPLGHIFVATLGIGCIAFGLYSISMSFWANVPKTYQ